MNTETEASPKGEIIVKTLPFFGVDHTLVETMKSELRKLDQKTLEIQHFLLTSRSAKKNDAQLFRNHIGRTFPVTLYRQFVAEELNSRRKPNRAERRVGQAEIRKSNRAMLRKVDKQITREAVKRGVLYETVLAERMAAQDEGTRV